MRPSENFGDKTALLNEFRQSIQKLKDDEIAGNESVHLRDLDVSKLINNDRIIYELWQNSRLTTEMWQKYSDQFNNVDRFDSRSLFKQFMANKMDYKTETINSDSIERLVPRK